MPLNLKNDKIKYLFAIFINLQGFERESEISERIRNRFLYAKRIVNKAVNQ